MGTHIDSFFPCSIERSPDSVKQLLAGVFAELRDDLALIRDRGQFSSDSGDWSIWLDDDGTTMSGEGPCGFVIDVYPAVVALTSIERIGAIVEPDRGIHESLRRVFETVTDAFGASGRLAIAAGGFGDTDAAISIAAEGAGFADVCSCLEANLGLPARDWSALKADSRSWYLSSCG